MSFKKFNWPKTGLVIFIILLAIVLGFLFLVPRFKPDMNAKAKVESASTQKTVCPTDKSCPAPESLAVDSLFNNKDEITMGLPESLVFCGQAFSLLCYSDSLEFFKSIAYFMDRPHLVWTYALFFGRYSPYYKKIFKGMDLPIDLEFLSVIESSLGFRAKSWAGAVGPWQFIKPTAVKHGLVVNEWVDQRHDPILSCQAAALYLKELYDEFGDWRLALAAYNGGENAVRKALKRHKEEGGGLFSLSQLHLPNETQNYPFLILAFKIIYETPEMFQVAEPPDSLEFDTVTVMRKKPLSLVDIASVCGVTGPEMRDLNPAYLKGKIPPGKWIIYLPAGTRQLFIDKLGQ